VQKPLYFRNAGALIAATLHLPRGAGRCAGVVCCHGFGGQKCEPNFIFVRLSRRLAKEGIASLRLDFRGSGESEGEFEHTTVRGQVSDARAALAQLKKIARVDSKRLGIVGLSFGGLVAALTAAREPSLKSVVLWGAVARPQKVFAANAPPASAASLRKTGRVDIGGLYVGAPLVEEIRHIDAPAEIAKSRASVLIVHAASDEMVPFVNSTDYLRAAKSRGIRAERISIKGADHLFSSVPWRDAVVEATVDWLKVSLS